MSSELRGNVDKPLDTQLVMIKVWLSDDSTTDVWEDDEPHADGNIQTHYMNVSPPWAHAIMITKVHYMMTPTAAETYSLYLYERAAAAALTQQMDLIYFSGAAQASGTEYIDTGGNSARVPVPAFIMGADYPSRIWYKLDWTGAPGATTGFIELRGYVVDRIDYNPTGGA